MNKKKVLSIITAFFIILNIIITPMSATTWNGRSPVAPGVAVTSNYRTSQRPTHNGIDFSGSISRDIFAVKAGTIVYIYNGCTHQNSPTTCCNGGSGYGGYGNVVVVRHSDGIHSMYAHIKQDSMAVSLNQTVKKGTVLAQMGNTGISEGIHLHLEIRTLANEHGAHRNPMDYINLNDFSFDDSPPIPTEGVQYRNPENYGLNLRTGPGSTKPTMIMIPSDTVFSVTDFADNWGRVTFNDLSGWVDLNQAEMVLAQYKTTALLNLRTGTDTTYSILTTIPKDTVVAVTEISNNWGKVSYGGFLGWISLEWVVLVG